MQEDLERLFRAQRAQLLSALTRSFGPRNLDLAETALQEAFLRAAKVWPAYGVPENPAGWLATAARNYGLDQLRRGSAFEGLTGQLQAELLEVSTGSTGEPQAAFEAELPDDELRMLFVVCHPALGLESQLALALRTLCGFEIPTIARALLLQEAAVAKRLVRAKERLREELVVFDLPQADLPARLSGVLNVLYQLFSEGYSAHDGELLIQRELCAEAIRLASLLNDNPLTALPKVHALLALMLLQASRLEARVTSGGDLLTLQEQDRGKWDPVLIREGLVHLEASAAGLELSNYHLEAAIAATHALAATYAQTNWARIAELYQQLYSLNGSLVVALNRAIALGFWKGAEQAIEELERLGTEPRLQSYPFLHAALGYFYGQAGRRPEARVAYQKALALAATEPERRYLQARLKAATNLET